MIELFTDLLQRAIAQFPAGGWQRLAVDALWQSTLVCMVALLLTRFLRERPAARGAVVLLAAALCLATPLASWAVRAGGWGLLTAQVAEPAQAISVRQVSRRDASAGASVRVQPAPIAPSYSDVDADADAAVVPGERMWQVLGAVWVVTSVALLVRLLRSAQAIARVCYAAKPCDDASVLDEFARAATTLGVRPPLLLTSETIASPALVALGQPRLLLPCKPPEKDQLYAVFCHELAHLARRDGLGRLAMELLTVALPWQPLAWLVRREFRTACEEACDDWAVASGADPVEFAAILTDFIPCQAPGMALGMAESIPAARYRILRLLAMQGLPRPRLGLFLGMAGWAVAIALLVTLAMLQRGNWPWSGGGDLPPWGNAPISFAAGNVTSPGERPSSAPYVIEPPDVLLIDAVKVVPKPPQKLEPLDVLKIIVVGTLGDQPISGPYSVEADGTVSLGFSYGSVKVGGLTLDEARTAIRKQLEINLALPEVYVTLAESAGKQQIAGEHIVGPDGRVNIGTYGSVFVSGLTIAEARAAIEKHLEKVLEQPEVSVDIRHYNSKVYYIVTENGANGEGQIIRITCTGSETVMDALAQIDGLKLSPGDWVYVARPTPKSNQILPVDWQAIFRGESSATNYWLQPGDRVFVRHSPKPLSRRVEDKHATENSTTPPTPASA